MNISYFHEKYPVGTTITIPWGPSNGITLEIKEDTFALLMTDDFAVEDLANNLDTTLSSLGEYASTAVVLNTQTVREYCAKEGTTISDLQEQINNEIQLNNDCFNHESPIINVD